MAYRNPSKLIKESTLVLLRRLFKIIEPLGVVDIGGRQRVTTDLINGATTLPTITTIVSVTNTVAQTSLAGMDREMYINDSRITHAVTLRKNLK
jgi:hypothetical protein